MNTDVVGYDRSREENLTSPLFVPSWPIPIPVSERLPEEGARVLVYAQAYWDVVHNWESDVYIDGDGASLGITHWLPLPPDP